MYVSAFQREREPRNGEKRMLSKCCEQKSASIRNSKLAQRRGSRVGARFEATKSFLLPAVSFSLTFDRTVLYMRNKRLKQSLDRETAWLWCNSSTWAQFPPLLRVREKRPGKTQNATEIRPSRSSNVEQSSDVFFFSLENPGRFSASLERRLETQRVYLGRRHTSRRQKSGE